MPITMAFEVRPSLKKIHLCETHGLVKLIESSTILHRATATAAFHNSDERFDPPKCHPNTRIAVLEKIMRWIKWEEDLDAFIMWVYGPVGAGKSAIAQTIAEMCEDELILLASFFFLKERSIAQHCQATYRHHRLPNHLEPSPSSKRHSRGHRT